MLVCEVRIALIIVNYNAGPFLERALDAVRSQVRRPDRIVVVDNASSDGSARCCEGRADVELLALTANEGFASANNRAVRHVADCEWVALLNPDAFPEPGWLAELEDATVRHPDVPVFASQQRLASAPGYLDGAGDAYHVSGLAWRQLHLMPSHLAPRDDVEVFSACAAAALYRRDVFVMLGGFDERFFAYMEDVDFGFRVRLAGFRCLYVAGACVLHVGSATTAIGSPFAVYHGQRNLVWTFVKNMPAWWGLVYLPQHLLATALTMCRLAARGQLRLAVQAKVDALRQLRAVMEARRRVQGLRRVDMDTLRRAMVTGWRTPYREHRYRQRHGLTGVSRQP